MCVSVCMQYISHTYVHAYHSHWPFSVHFSKMATKKIKRRTHSNIQVANRIVLVCMHNNILASDLTFAVCVESLESRQSAN